MSFNTKAIIFSIMLVCSVGFAARHYYGARQPKPAVIVPREEITLTIIPGWNLRDVADYLVEKGVASTTLDVYKVVGKPADRKDPSGSAEGALAPETIRFYKGASVEEVVEAFRAIRAKQMTSEMEAEIKRRKLTPREVLIMASIVEREARTSADRKIVAGILWKRVQIGMALQVDSSVHYAIDKTGDVFTTDQERATDSPWNTYKHPGLPPSPICMPSLDSIMAALYPEKTPYLYFLSGTDGKMHYAKDLDAHNVNRYKYIR